MDNKLKTYCVMKKNKLKNHAQSQSNRIHFEYTSPSAKSVSIAGTFNGWQPNATPRIALSQGRWAKHVVLSTGDHEYCRVVARQRKPVHMPSTRQRRAANRPHSPR